MRFVVSSTVVRAVLCAVVCGSLPTACPEPPGDDGGEGEGELGGGGGEGEGEGPLEEPDPNDPENASKDVDCDGLSDADEFGTIWPGAGGAGGKTDPGNADSDGDGVNDGVEAGAGATVDDRCGDRFPDGFPGDADAGTTSNPTDADSDDDGLLDGAEDTNGNGRVDPGETNPTNPDSDGDGFCDGANDVTGACVGNDDPQATLDSDGDGLPDRLDAAPNDPDADDDGFCDGGNTVASVCERGEDLDNDGALDPGESDPSRGDVDCDGLTDQQERDAGTDQSNPDSDNDGVKDGVELGSSGSSDGACPPGSGRDDDPATTSDPLDDDSDGDGLLDGQEDNNGNGSVDDGEFDPGDGADADDDVVQRACSGDNLVPLSAIVSTAANIQIVVDARAVGGGANAFNQRGVVNANGAEVGVFGFDAGASVGFAAVSRAPAGGDALVDELAVRDAVDDTAPIGQPIFQSFTTWDGFPAVQARYDQAGDTGVKARLNALVQSLVPGATAPFDVAGDVQSNGVRVEVEVVRRSATQTVVVVGVLPLAIAQGTGAQGDGLFPLRDLVDGSALGKARDGQGVHCERKDAVAFSTVDILWSVDNSSSMGDEQAAVAAAAQAFVDKLGNSTVDWRAAVVTSGFYNPRTSQDPACTNAVCEPRTTSQCRPFTRDVEELRASFTQTDPAWVGAGGDCNQSREEIVESARLILSNESPGASFFPPSAAEDAGKLRDDASLLVILFGDADDLRFENADAAGGIDTFEGFLRALPMPVSIGGILCAEDQECGEDQRSPRVARAVVNRFGGVIGTLNDLDSIPAVVDAILDSAIADSSPYILAQDAISASVKVAVADGSTIGACNVDDVPRSRESGFDVDARTRTINFFGDCRPVVQGATIAISYRTWVEPPAQPEGPCLCQCGGNLTCNDTGQDVCGCQCTQDLTCAAGFAFDDDACGCVCDVGAAAALCPATHELDPDTCSCSCKDACGGCGDASFCQQSLCTCSGIGG